MPAPKWMDPTKKRRKRNGRPYSNLSPAEKKIRSTRVMASAAKKPHLKKAIAKAHLYRLRIKTLAVYGSACVCCGEREPSFLALDHVNNDGAAHRRELQHTSAQKVCRWAFDNRDGTIQVLCHNCNLAKAFYGICPHESMKRLVGEA